MPESFGPHDLDGNPITLESLPAGKGRWTGKRKAIVVRAVLSGLISLAEALERYHMTVQEFSRWQEQLREIGLHGLKVTKYNELCRQANVLPKRKIKRRSL